MFVCALQRRRRFTAPVAVGSVHSAPRRTPAGLLRCLMRCLSSCLLPAGSTASWRASSSPTQVGKGPRALPSGTKWAIHCLWQALPVFAPRQRRRVAIKSCCSMWLGQSVHRLSRKENYLASLPWRLAPTAACSCASVPYREDPRCGHHDLQGRSCRTGVLGGLVLTPRSHRTAAGVTALPYWSGRVRHATLCWHQCKSDGALCPSPLVAAGPGPHGQAGGTRHRHAGQAPGRRGEDGGRLDALQACMAALASGCGDFGLAGCRICA